MIIMLIHWKIRPDENSLRKFKERWRQMEPPHPGHFSGEYLSEPVPREEAGFPCTTFNVSSAVQYNSFFNVAIWRSIDDFRNDILGDVVAGRPDIEPFEFDHRERMVLRPVMSRRGDLPTPVGPGLDV